MGPKDPVQRPALWCCYKSHDARWAIYIKVFLIHFWYMLFYVSFIKMYLICSCLYPSLTLFCLHNFSLSIILCLSFTSCSVFFDRSHICLQRSFHFRFPSTPFHLQLHEVVFLLSVNIQIWVFFFFFLKTSVINVLTMSTLSWSRSPNVLQMSWLNCSYQFSTVCCLTLSRPFL